MSQFNTLRAFSPDVAIERMEERPQQYDPIPTAYPAVAFPVNVAAGDEQQQSIHSGYLLTPSGPLHDIPTTQSLVTALQATMTTPVARHILIIPGNKRRTCVLPETTGMTHQAPTTRRLTPHLRYGIIVGAILFVLCLTFVSLAPLDNGQNSFHLIGGVIEWAYAQQQDWNIAAHNLHQDITQSNTNTSPSISNNSTVAPPSILLPTSQYVAVARQDAINVGISPDYFVRQIYAESGFNPSAVSPYGAVGVAQFLPGTAAGLGVNPWDPTSALSGAANLMASYNRQYGGDYAKALAAYNAGTGNVNNATSACGANWLSCLPGETQNYIRTIMG